uniref:Mating-type protein A-alpha Y1 n=1 Tax=Schizophyllum commune TaxID=5334 RepID=MAAY1_SCHCO|nr:RecName: Full=Mating-type protein A-alpha Y1 [Schizophyllum commune]AAB01367.1 A-alpha-Y1 protein [Schizophyllum commune]
MTDRLASLRAISASAKSMMSIAAARGAQPTAPIQTAPVHFDPLPTPYLDGIRARLTEVKLPPKALKSALNSYDQACARWRYSLDESFSQAARSVSPHNLHLLSTLRFRLYTEQVERWAVQVLQVAEQWRAEMEKQRAHIAASTDKSKKPRPKFHSEYTPLLELYFRFNAYPTYADRRVLAEKTGMLTRQITVWFQNHRRRAKGPLPRMTPTAKIPLEEFERERENLARKLLPMLLPPHLRPITLGNNKTPDLTTSSRARALPPAKEDKPPQVTRKTSKKVPKTAHPAPSTLVAPSQDTVMADAISTKKTKKAKSKQCADIEMKDSSKPKRRKMKKLPKGVVGTADVAMCIDPPQVPKKNKVKPKKSMAFDSQAELAFAQAAYPSPSKYAWVHTRKPQTDAPKAKASSVTSDVARLGKGRPGKPSPPASSTVPSRRVSTRLNAMRPPYAFPARYDSAAVPMTFAVAQVTKFTFATDSASFGFKPRISTRRPNITSDAMSQLVSSFERLRLLSVELSVSRNPPLPAFEHQRLVDLRVEGLTSGEVTALHFTPGAYAARLAVTYIPPRAPLPSTVLDLPRALRARLVHPMVLPETVTQPDAFAPFIALAERRARRKARKEKKRQEEKQAKKDKKERKKAGLPHRAPSTVDAPDVSSRASSLDSDVSTSARKSSKKSKRQPSSSSRASSVASSGRTPSLSSTSSRRSSGMSMPSTPGPEQSLPIVAASDFALGGEEDVSMDADLMAQLFGSDENADAVGYDLPMHPEPFTADMITFTSCADGALGDMTADVNMPNLGQSSIDDMNWTASVGSNAQDPASQESGGDEASHWLDISFDRPTTTSQINVLGGTYSCELGGSDNMNAPLDFSDLTFGLDTGADYFSGFNNTIGGTTIMV